MPAVVPNLIFGLGSTKCDKMFSWLRLISTGWSLSLLTTNGRSTSSSPKQLQQFHIPSLTFLTIGLVVLKKKKLSIKNLSIHMSCTPCLGHVTTEGLLWLVGWFRCVLYKKAELPHVEQCSAELPPVLQSSERVLVSSPSLDDSLLEQVPGLENLGTTAFQGY